jgi:hypothetical protein
MRPGCGHQAQKLALTVAQARTRNTYAIQPRTVNDGSEHTRNGGSICFGKIRLRQVTVDVHRWSTSRPGSGKAG